jgi:hypothetical protein
MTRTSRLKSYDLGKYEGPFWLGLGKFGLGMSAEKARHAESDEGLGPPLIYRWGSGAGATVPPTVPWR